MRTKICLLYLVLSLILVRCELTDCPECTGIEGQLPESGMLAYYPFLNNAIDESNNGHDGIISGAEFKEDRHNVTNQSLFFDGIDDFVELDSMDSFNSTLETFSISFWLKGDSLHVTHYETIMKTINDDPAGTMFSIEVHRGPYSSLNIGVIRLDIRDNFGRYFTIYVDKPVVFDNRWHNITFIVSSAKNNQGDVFIDGELESKDYWFVSVGSESPGAFNMFDHSLTIGAGNNRGTIETFFNGYLDEIVFYNRPLSTVEILQLYYR